MCCCKDEQIELSRQVEINLTALRRTEAAVAQVKGAELVTPEDAAEVLKYPDV